MVTNLRVVYKVTNTQIVGMMVDIVTVIILLYVNHVYKVTNVVYIIHEGSVAMSREGLLESIEVGRGVGNHDVVSCLRLYPNLTVRVSPVKGGH
jgi:hypothetical protein